jgi:hypothetical protein
MRQRPEVDTSRLLFRCISALALALLLSACHKRNAVPDASVIATPTVALRLERGACYGRCPQYAVELFTDGAVRFAGQRFVADTGIRTAQIASATVDSLRARAIAHGFATLDSSYTPGMPNCKDEVTDLPMNVLAVRVDTALKVVHHYLGCGGTPAILSELATAVDSIAGTTVWINGSTGTKK